jgi:hypothetical protein
MSAQGTAFWEKRLGDNKEVEALEQKTKRDEAAKWNTQQMLASVMPNNSGRIIDWRRF